MQNAELDDKGEADEGECVKSYHEERRPSVLVSQEGAGKTRQDKN